MGSGRGGRSRLRQRIAAGAPGSGLGARCGRRRRSPSGGGSRAVKMATPGMGWQQPQHSYGGGSAPGAGKLGSGSAQAGLSAEHSADLHFKMSKKIAQLTKVREARRVLRRLGCLPPPLCFLSLPALMRAAMGLERGRLSGLMANPGGLRPGVYPGGRAWSALGPWEHPPAAAGRSAPWSRGESSGSRGLDRSRARNCRSTGLLRGVRIPPGTARYPGVRERIPDCWAGTGYLFCGNCSLSSSAVISPSPSLFKWRHSSDACLPFSEVRLSKVFGNSLNALDGEGEV